MLSVSRPVESAPFPPGHRHGIPNNVLHEAQISLYPPKRRSETIARSGGYLSPPMSGSPPFEPARAAQDFSSSGGSPRHNMLRDTSQIRWRAEPHPAVAPNQSRGLLPLSNTYPQETPRDTHFRRRSEHRLPPMLTHNTPESISGLHGTPRQPYVSPAPSMTPQHTAAQTQGPVPEPSNRVTPPRSQRKPKGHVASACVPCKKAHLRCDAQRPCARCVSHGKEDTCVDVRHKKRGRPRLRDDRDSRMDAARFPHAHGGSEKRTPNIRPASMGQALFYDSPGSSIPSTPASAFTSPETSGARFMPRVFSAGARTHGERYSLSSAESPVVYMRTNMEVVKASSSFSEAIGAIGLIGRRITEVLAPETSEAMIELCTALNIEQKRRDPTYLPPIFDKGDEAARALSFAPETVHRIGFDHHAYATFRAHDGNTRSYPIRLGLLKEGSFFFIAALLSVQSRALHQPAASHSRNVGHALPRAPMLYGTPTAVDLAHRRFSDGPSALRREVGMGAQSTPRRSSPGSGYQSIYSPALHGGEYSRPSPLQIPRSELGAPLLSRSGESQYTLPPIRSLAERTRDLQERDEKHKRVSIGGLMNSTVQ
ncbi:hypothetical protein LLEC1_02644 [Akanthomyces lecanii]|uniref:Zn(2)-C6 fungal-type domain-containing protein n=1 Tax=Cordyceps confragosa TaxID=2714763 RepID=A0A179I8J0_CORDF|nr:hypothetical protein LLEC1_02644 [Akanthomyces lecanii]